MTFNWDEKMKFQTLGGVVVRKANIQIYAIRQLYNNYDTFLSKYYEEEINNEVSIINDDFLGKVPDTEVEDMLDDIRDRSGLSHEAKLILSNYAIVAAYSFYEIGLKEIMRLTNKFTDNELKVLYRVKDTINLLKTKFQIEFREIDDCTQLEELRTLNNSIKHQGKVDRELVAANNKWILDTLIEDTWSDFERLKDAPRTFLQNLVVKIEPHI